MNHPHGITFRGSDHSYWTRDGRQLISVTTAVKEITPPFDRDRIAERCARRDRMSVDEVLAQWEAKSEAARERGTRVHAYAEGVIDGTIDPILDALNVREPEMDAFDLAWKSMKDNLKAEVVWKERVVGDPELGIAGRADILLSVEPKDSKRCLALMDWKTGSFAIRGQWANLLPPWDDLGDCELTRYSIQLSAYRLCLEREDPSAVYGDSYLVHLRRDGGYNAFRATDYRERVLAWLTERQWRLATL